jgi:beta-galactosidase
VDLPHYLQARLTNDYFKGGHTNAYETTGGPVQYSGGYGNHMDAGLMRKMMLNYLAAGNEGIAFWAWKSRPGGIEAGEYGLVGLSGRVTEWAAEAGRVIAGMDRHRREIWQAANGTELAILRSWDTETVMCCEPRRYECEDGPSPWSRGPAQQHIRALIGAGRAAVHAQLACEFVTEEEILAGIAGAYPAIYLPHVRCCSDPLLAKLQEYVTAGGRLIADVQIGFEDQWGKLRPTGPGGVVERMFGAYLDAIGDTGSRPVTVDGVAVHGFFGDLVPTTATVLRRFDTGKPAVTEARIGRGTAVLLAIDAGRQCWRPGDLAMERLLAGHLRGNAPRRFACDMPMTFRRECAAADHYFVINDGPARSAVLQVFDRTYARVEDVLAEREIACIEGIPVEVEAYGGLWLRCVRPTEAH